MEAQRLDFADAMRGIAILAIILLHAGIYFLPATAPKWLINLSAFGRFGVQIFFMISAFTLYYALTYAHRNGEGWIQFFQRRFFRIAPLFYAAILVYGVLLFINQFTILGASNADVTAYNIFLHFTFLFAFVPALFNTLVPGCWTIANEMLFYVLIPVIYTFVKKLHTAILLLFCGGIVGVISWIYMSQSVSLPNQSFIDYLYFWFPNQFPTFCYGIVLFYLLKHSLFDEGWIYKLSNIKKQIISLLCICASGIIVYYIIPYVTTPMGQYLLYGAFLLFILAFAIYPYKVLVNKYTIYLGKISYSCYITHFIVISVIYGILQLITVSSNFKQIPEIYASIVFIALFALSTLITIGVSTLTYKYIEVPGISLGKRLMRK